MDTPTIYTCFTCSAPMEPNYKGGPVKGQAWVSLPDEAGPGQRVGVFKCSSPECGARFSIFQHRADPE